MREEGPAPVGAFGERLRKEREQRNLSLEDISQATKISARSLRALEAEDFAKLPGGVFNRGFVRAYARQLGVDEESLITLYLDATGEVLPSQVQEVAPEASAGEPSPSPGQELGSGLSLIRLAIGGAIIAVILLAAFWFLRHRTPAESSATPGGTYAQPAPSPRSSASSPESKNPAPVVRPSGTPSQAAPQTVQPTTANAIIPQSAAQTQTISAAKGGIELSLHALDEVWLSAAIDGQPAQEDTLFVNNRRTLRARERIVLKVGSAGALEVSFNGKKMSSLGEYGQVKTLTFLPSGLETPAPPVARAN